MTIRSSQFDMGLQDIDVLSHARLSSIVKNSYFKDFSNFTILPDKLYFTTRAISARVNRNYDGFPSQELKKYHHTFVGRPYFVNHANADHTRTRGMLLGSRYLEDGNDKYIKLLCSIDANAFPKLSEQIGKGNLDGVSMGVDVEKTICSYCYRIAKTPNDFCDHILYMKGQILDRPNKFGRKESVLVFEACYGLNFFELSSVFDPADETALVQEVLLPRMAKTGTRYFNPGERAHEITEKWPHIPGLDVMATNKVALGESTAPPRVDTLREESNCPQCGDSSFDGATCQFCGYNAGPAELQDPDLDMASQIDRDQDNNLDVNGVDDGSGNGGLADAIHETIENLEGLFELEQIVQQFAEGIAPPSNNTMPMSDDTVSPLNSQPEEIPSDSSEDTLPAGNMDETSMTPLDEAHSDDQSGEIPADSGTPLEGQEPPTEDIAVDQPPGQEVAPEEENTSGAPEMGGVPQDQNSEMTDVEQQVQDLVEGVDQLVQQLSGQPGKPGEEENPEMPRTLSHVRTPALSSVADRVAQAQKRLKDAQKRLADLSQNVVQINDTEAIADTPPAEAGTSSTDAERNGEGSRTNVQDLDANPATREEETRPEERQTVEMPTRSVAKLASQDIESIFAYCDKHTNMDLGTALAKSAYDFANAHKISSKIVLAQVLAAANKRKGSLGGDDVKSLASMSELFVRRVKAENDDPYDMMSNKDNLQLAKPQDRVDVEAPVENDTNDYAQESQFDPDKYDKNRGADIAKPDDVNTMNWWPGEKPTINSNYTVGTTGIATGNFNLTATPVQKASAVDAIKLAESYIDLGVFSADLKYDKIAEFEELPKISVQQQQFALDAVRRASSANGQKPRGVVPRAAAGHRPVPQMGRAATFNPSASDDMTWLAL